MGSDCVPDHCLCFYFVLAVFVRPFLIASSTLKATTAAWL